ncbi:hypothetical protein SLS59_001139 [Nothophoma quercina]|uniref:DUF6536 domain-containing protein n=1 Tax=Nothophoma quercina TaxID=749835 RepID=A0ABR3RYY7_9PLEO
MVSLIALIINVFLFAWLLRRYKTLGGTGTVHKSNCSEVENIETGIKVGLNVLSTLVLACLSIFFNAVFFTTTDIYQYAVAVVDYGFQSNTGFQATPENSSPTLPQFEEFVWQGKCEGFSENSCDWNVKDDDKVVKLLNDVRNPDRAQDFERLPSRTCMDAYTEGFMQNYSDVVVITKTIQPGTPVLWTRYPQRILSEDKQDTNNDPFHWVCKDTLKFSNESGICYKNDALNNIDPNSWTVQGHGTFANASPRWWTGANTTEFFASVGISAAYVIILSGSLGWALSETNGNAYAHKIGRPDIQSLTILKPDDTGSSGIVPTLITANIPQLGFSLLYVIYTNIWSKLLIAHEFDRLTVNKKGLRVSDRPRGEQRTSHFFTLPIRYAFPLMACSAALHWLCSRSLFMARFDGVDVDGELDKRDQLVRLAYNVQGMTALIGVNFAMVVATVSIAGFRRLRTGLGEIAMSVVISAACHVKRYEAEPWLQKVQWGDVSEGIGEVRDGQIVRHCAFTSLLAEPPTEEHAYQ